MNPLRLSEQLIQVAKARLNESVHRNEANLRRATSDLYYAVFHAVCEALVDPMSFSNPIDDAYIEIYTSIYRQVRHDHLEKKCKLVAQGTDFTVELRQFAKQVVQLKNKRELADYHPLERFSVSVIRNDVGMTESRLNQFWNADPKTRTAFASYVGLKVN